MREIIAVSGKQYAGKDLLADFLLQELPEYSKIPISRAIKMEFAALYGLTPPGIEEQKALYRSGLIAIGQRRRQKDPDYWIERVMMFPGPKLVSDLRLIREYEFFKRHGAFLVRVEANRAIRAKRGTLVSEDDPTECELDGVTGWDAVVTNNGTVEDLRQQAKKLAEQIRQASEAV